MPTALIIGAGPAGSAAAILLCRAGWNVTLIEQHRFPREKVCGECLSALGIDVLSRIGVLHAIQRIGPVQLAKCAIVAPTGAIAAVQLPQPMLGVSRAALDTILLDQARAVGATILQPARCESIDSARVLVHVRDLVTNQIDVHRADYILIADGKPAGRGSDTRDFGVKAHFADVDDDPATICLFGLSGHYIGLAPIEGNIHNAAMSVPAERIRRFKSDLDALFEKCLSENAGLARRFQHARRVSPWLASRLPRFPVAPTWHPRVIPLGNAAAALEPIGGEGMGLALRSAELLAAWLASSRNNLAELRAQFIELWQTRRLAARATALVLSRPRLAKLAVRALNLNQRLARPVMATLGKSRISHTSLRASKRLVAS